MSVQRLLANANNALINATLSASSTAPVSYTHLDVYKRQLAALCRPGAWSSLINRFAISIHTFINRYRRRAHQRTTQQHDAFHHLHSSFNPLHIVAPRPEFLYG